VRRLTIAALMVLLASAGRAEEDRPLVVRQLVGISASGSDAGFGLGAQLGIRLSPILLRFTLDVGGNGRHGYAGATFRGDWLHPLGENAALVTGIGFGRLSYGFIFDDPTNDLTVLTPEVGVLFGPDRLFGRIMAGLTGFVPLGAVSHERDFAGQAISPPHVMATLLLSL
jgi:hypothetical protein